MGKEPDSAPFDYHSQSTLVRKMKSFGVDAEWIPGEERRHRLKMTAMKPSGNHPSAASVAGRRRRSAESARAACPRRWVGSRGGCALLSLHTGSRYLAMPSRPRAHATHRAAAPRAHPPPWASSPGRFRASPASPGDGSDASVVSRRFHCRHFEPMAALLARNPLRIHPETFHFPY